MDKYYRRGLSILEIGLALALVATVFVGISHLMVDNAAGIRAKASAERLTQISHAADAYIRANSAALEAALPAGSANVVSIPIAKSNPLAAYPEGSSGFQSLQEAGLLSEGFVDKNSAGQSHVLLVTRNPSNGLAALVTAIDGEPFTDRDLGTIASSVGAAGGAVYSSAAIAPNTAVTGSYGGWSYETSRWQGSLKRAGETSFRLAAPSAGRPALSLEIESRAKIAQENAPAPNAPTVPRSVVLAEASWPKYKNSITIGGLDLSQFSTLRVTLNDCYIYYSSTASPTQIWMNGIQVFSFSKPSGGSSRISSNFAIDLDLGSGFLDARGNSGVGVVSGYVGPSSMSHATNEITLQNNQSDCYNTNKDNQVILRIYGIR